MNLEVYRPQNLHDYLEREARRALQGECVAPVRLSEAELEMDRKSWERRNSDVALFETNIQLESKQMELYHANQWACQAQMENPRIFEESMMKRRLYTDSHSKVCFEIEELRRICWEGTKRARQMRTDELYVQKKDEPSTVNQLLSQIQDLQDKVNALKEEKGFYAPETASSSGMSDVPSQLPTIPSPRGMIAAILDSRTTHGTRWVLQEMFLKTPPAQKEYLRNYLELP